MQGFLVSPQFLPFGEKPKGVAGGSPKKKVLLGKPIQPIDSKS